MMRHQASEATLASRAIVTGSAPQSCVQVTASATGLRSSRDGMGWGSRVMEAIATKSMSIIECVLCALLHDDVSLSSLFRGFPGTGNAGECE